MKKFGDDSGGALVADIAYSAFLALFPLLLMLVSILDLVLSGHPGWRTAIERSAFSNFPLVGGQLRASIHPLHRSSIVGLVVGFVGLAWGSLGLAQAGQSAMATVWSVPRRSRPGYAKRLARGIAFVGVLGAGLVATALLAGFGTFGRHVLWLGVVGELLAVAVNSAQHLLAFRVLTPNTVGTRRLVPGAVLGGVGWTVLLALGGYLIGHDLRNDSALYGTFATVLGLVAWVYLGTEWSIISAELNPVLSRRLWPRALVPPPVTDGDRRSLVFERREPAAQPADASSVEDAYERASSTA